MLIVNCGLLFSHGKGKGGDHNRFKLLLNVPSFACRLDIGDGKELDLKDCPRSKLRQQCIRYLGPVGASVINSLKFSTIDFYGIHFVFLRDLKFYPSLCYPDMHFFFRFQFPFFCLWLYLLSLARENTLRVRCC